MRKESKLWNFEKLWEEMALVYLIVLCRNFPVATEENHVDTAKVTAFLLINGQYYRVKSVAP
jgi:hypothetical protein